MGEKEVGFPQIQPSENPFRDLKRERPDSPQVLCLPQGGAEEKLGPASAAVGHLCQLLGVKHPLSPGQETGSPGRPPPHLLMAAKLLFGFPRHLISFRPYYPVREVKT